MLSDKDSYHVAVVVKAFTHGCDFCKRAGSLKRATVDGKTKHGPWAFMCDKHFKTEGVGLGIGKGQRLVTN